MVGKASMTDLVRIDLDGPVFWATFFGAVFGTSVPLVAELILRPIQRRREQRVGLYLEPVPTGIDRAENAAGRHRAIAVALEPIERRAMLLGRGDRQVVRAVTEMNVSMAIGWGLPLRSRRGVPTANSSRT
jgi:hypothetical protein